MPPSHTTGHAGPHPAVRSSVTKSYFVLSYFSLQVSNNGLRLARFLPAFSLLSTPALASIPSRYRLLSLSSAFLLNSYPVQPFAL